MKYYNIYKNKYLKLKRQLSEIKYTYKQEIISDDTTKIRYYGNDIMLTYKQVIDLWNDKNFVDVFIEPMKNVNYDAYLFETTPVSIDNLDIEFEYVLIKSDSLSKIKSDPVPFSEYLNKCNKNITVFKNPSGDTTLIVPCIKDKIEIYAHIAKFIRNAPNNQIYDLFKMISKKIKKLLGKNKVVYLSTHGLGVYWLHVRLDQKPKYYRHQEYKN